MTTKKILCIGPITKDINIINNKKEKQIGGAIYYQTQTLTQLQKPTTAIITLNKKNQKLLEKLPKTTDIKQINTPETLKFINTYTNNTRTQKTNLTKNPITVEKIKETKINLTNYDTALLSPLTPYDIPIETIKYIKKHDITTILGAQGYIRNINKQNQVKKIPWKNYEKYLKYTDILFLDENEIKIALNIPDIKHDTIKEIINKNNLKEIIITKAKKGSEIHTKTKQINIPSIPTKNPQNPTGLGDTYMAAYIYKKQYTKDPYICGLFAAITATYKLETNGILNKTKEDIKKQLNKILKEELY
ncbi:MAG: PfkB family carbohydrate kinase [Methanobacteriaceae archaeon]|nr:PfkB family carbohydrate kinase [Methanobacteriaceae archaeon]